MYVTLTRRDFVKMVAGAGIGMLALGGLGIRNDVLAKQPDAAPNKVEKNLRRIEEAYNIRHRAALLEKKRPRPSHPTNGDEELYANKIASYSKCLPHNNLGEVSLPAYESLIMALKTGSPQDFESIQMGGVVRLVNPQAAYAFELIGPDSHHLGMMTPPSFSSAEEASEMGEVYWQALVRDVPFSEYDTDTLIDQAAEDLSNFSDFRGPKDGSSVTPETIFRGNTSGDLAGPYISQFLWKDIPYGAITMPQKINTPFPSIDFMTNYNDWLNIQNGTAAGPLALDPTPHYIRNGRDLGEYVHLDWTYQAHLGACLMLLRMSAPLDTGNPYLGSLTQDGFPTFGGPHILHLVGMVGNLALKAAWFQKWLVHRRLRPEEFAGCIHNHKTGAANYPINTEILDSDAVAAVFDKYGTYLLPQAYPEGCPTHTAYPSGHASFVGACSTVLKAFFNESFVIPDPVEASPDGLSLVPYSGPDLTVGGELNKLASNIGFGRDFAGLHWRSDIIEGMKLGEEVSILVLAEMRLTFNENFGGFFLTKFDGTQITI
ncbi:MAG: hypothetical protein HMLIMOIP_000834 [Candidatus Nitrosomirales archaeon]|jgi:hypothetical protein